AASGPLLVVVDDLHWCDLPSLRGLAYLLPRLEGLDISIIAGLMSSEPGEDPSLLGQILSDPLTTFIRPAPLTEMAVGQLVRETIAPGAEDEFCRSCHRATGGNPLLVHELLGAIAADGL